MNSYLNFPPKAIINKEIYLFLFSLLKSIFIFDSENRKKKIEKIDTISNKIKDIYKIELKREYSKKNFQNIIQFVKNQNLIYAGEILENIVLSIFTSIMSIPQNETINNYIYNNLLNIYSIKNKDEKARNEEIDFIQNFIIYDNLYPEELKNKNIFFQPYSIIQTILEYFLALIYKLRINSIKNNKKNVKDQYHKISFNLYNNSSKYSENKEEKNLTKNSIIEFENNIDKIIDNYKEGSQISPNTNIISYFFFTLFVNYQTINNRLMKFYIDNKDINKFACVPYEYNIVGGSMKGFYAILISSPMRQDNRIKSISMIENDLGEIGMFELGKTIVFNPSIKTLNYSKNRLYSYYLHYFNKASKIFENNSIEEINIYNNFFKDDIDDYLCDILKKFKNLKILNLSSNKIGSGLAKFLSLLKLLYRQKKSKLVKLNINKTSLHSSSIYELCQLLKNKFCKLESLYLNINYINDYDAEPLLDAIKKNNSLKEVYLSRNFIGNSSTDKIGKVISRFHESLEVLYLNQNEIRNNENLLRIAARTKVIYSIEEDRNEVILDLDSNPILKNLDLSKNGVNYKNEKQILILNQILKDTYLSCLDYSVTLTNFDNKNFICENYKKEINVLKEKLSNIKDERNKLFEYLEEMKLIKRKYDDKFEKYLENEDIIDILVQTIKDSDIFQAYEDIDNLMSYDLLEAIGKKEEDLNDADNLALIRNLIKYMLLYKVNGGIINQWLKGINKCLVII